MLEIKHLLGVHGEEFSDRSVIEAAVSTLDKLHVELTRSFNRTAAGCNNRDLSVRAAVSEDNKKHQDEKQENDGDDDGARSDDGDGWDNDGNCGKESLPTGFRLNLTNISKGIDSQMMSAHQNDFQEEFEINPFGADGEDIGASIIQALKNGPPLLPATSGKSIKAEPNKVANIYTEPSGKSLHDLRTGANNGLFNEARRITMPPLVVGGGLME